MRKLLHNLNHSDRKRTIMPPQQGVSVDDELNNTPPPLPAAHPDHGIGNDDDANNRNVNLILTYTGMAFAGRAVWNQSCLPTLIFLLRDDTKAVGVITGVMGLSQLLASIPTGILADKYRRDTLLKIGAVFGVAAIVAMLCEIVVRPGYPLLVVALVLWGAFSSTLCCTMVIDYYYCYYYYLV